MRNTSILWSLEIHQPLGHLRLLVIDDRFRAHLEILRAHLLDILLKGLVEAKFRFLESDLPIPASPGTPGITSLAERDFLRGLLPRYRAVVPRAKGPDGR